MAAILQITSLRPTFLREVGGAVFQEMEEEGGGVGTAGGSS